MHLSIVHKENVEIKQEPSYDVLEKEIEEPEKVPFYRQICEKAFSDERNLEKQFMRKVKHLIVTSVIIDVLKNMI